MNTSSSLLWFLALSALLVGCREAPAPAATPVVRIGVSVAPQAWLVERLGGERVEVLTMVPATASPATYQPTDAQVSQLLAARAYLRIGVPCERGRWFAALESSGKVEIVDQAEGVELRPIDHASGAALDHAADGDPHIWLSPPLLAIQARTVTALLARLDPAHEARFRANLARLERDLESLDLSLAQVLKPLAGRRFFVFHPSWGYFAERYGLRQVAIELDGKEPTDRQITLLQEEARQGAIRAIFVQPQIAGRSAQAVAEAVGLPLVVLDPMAPEVMANLLRTAETLVAAYAPPTSEEPR